MAKKQDVQVQDEGSVVLFHLLSRRAQAWVDANVQDGAMFLGDALAVEHRYAQALAQGMIGDGLRVR